jgi:serine/threonine protein kinase
MKSAISWSDLESVAEIGGGQAGVVMKARVRTRRGDLQVGDWVAVKRYRPWCLEQPGQMERIFRELEAGRRISHPALVRTLAVIADDAGRPVLLMKYYEGETWSRCSHACGWPVSP